MRRVAFTLAALLGGIHLASATVTVQGWWHLDSTQPINDSSGNSRTFGSAYSTAPATGGSVAAQLINNGVGGPLDATGWISTNCIQVGVGVGGKRQSSMWGIGYNPPAQNYGIEIWVLPQDNGIAGGTGGWILSSGQSGGVAFRVNAPVGNPSYIDAFDVGNSMSIGSQVPLDTNQWMHLALVNNGGITTFYTNGIACGPSVTNGTSTPAGDVYAISAPGDNQAFYGFLDEARMFTFAAGAFSTNDLLLRPAGPIINGQPQNAIVWNGGAAPFNLTAALDNSLTYQWQRGGTNISGATSSAYLLPIVALTDSSSTFDCKLTASSLTVTSATATLTVVPPNASDVAAYRNLVTTEPTLLGYWPVDNCTGAVVTNTVDAAYNGALELNASYDGRTNRSFGQRALSFNADGDVQVPNNTNYEFGSGFGTIEALVYLSQQPANSAAIVWEGSDGGAPYYALLASANGSFLIYTNDTTLLTWPVAGGLIGKFAHVALVFDNGTNVTPYVNGQSLGTQQQTSFGSSPGGPLWFGAVGNTTTDSRWVGTIDEVAVYSSALSAADIQSHFTKFFYGTNNAPPVILSQPSSKTMLAGGSPQLLVSVAGALPFTYQWTSNNIAIPGATSASLTLVQTKTTSSATYELNVSNVFGSTNTQPIVLTFVAPPAGYVSRVMNDNPTAFWRLADTAGPTAADSAGLYDGTYTSSGVTYAAGGAPGDTNAGALFDGSTGRALVPNTSAINPNGPFTIEFWGRLAAYGFYVPLSSMNRPSRDSGYEFYIDGNSAGYEFHTAAGGGYNMITADDHVPGNGVWTYVVGVYDGTNIFLYVNGALGDIQEDPPLPAGEDNWMTEGAPPFNPDTAEPFYLASRSDNTHYYHGTLADVAFYNYALTPAQITTHWSYGWTPSHITQSPIGVTNVEGSTITLTAVASGVPNIYQWIKDGTVLADVSNPVDNTPHYSTDVTNSTLTITEARPADSGEYWLVVTNPLGNSVSAQAKVLVLPDTNRPMVTAVTGLGTPNGTGPTPYLVKVNFNKRIDPATGGNTFNYVLSPSVAINTIYVSANTTAAAFGSDWRTVFLETVGLTPGTKYTLTVSGILDQAQTPNTIPTMTVGFRAPLLTSGVLDWDYYYEITPQAVASLTSAPNYPFGPQTNWITTDFDSDQITGGDLNNVPAFGAAGDNYGDSLSGWITPTVSGQYYFFLASDDSSELLLSYDSNPANAQIIAEETGCCHGFQEPGAPTTSDLQSLTAGTAYFIQALHTEGGGGDYVKVAWRSSTDNTAATNLVPIQAQFLSAYAPVAAPRFTSTLRNGGTLTISWTGYQAVLEQSADLKTWAPVPGNPNPLVINVQVAPRMFYRLEQ